MPSGPFHDRIDVVNALRAFATIFVAWGHFSSGRDAGSTGAASTHTRASIIFFGISGFIIPYSLYRGGYTLRNFGRFVLKRGIPLCRAASSRWPWQRQRNEQVVYDLTELYGGQRRLPRKNERAAAGP